MMRCCSKIESWRQRVLLWTLTCSCRICHHDHICHVGIRHYSLRSYLCGSQKGKKREKQKVRMKLRECILAGLCLHGNFPFPIVVVWHGGRRRTHISPWSPTK